MRRLKHRIACARSDEARDAGFTVLEAVVSFVLFAAVVAGATTGIVNSAQAAHTSQKRVDAANIAQQYVAATRSSRSTVKQGTTTFSPPAVGVETFTATRTIDFGTPGITQCPAGATGTMFSVDVQVSDARTGTFLARSDARVLC